MQSLQQVGTSDPVLRSRLYQSLFRLNPEQMTHLQKKWRRLKLMLLSLGSDLVAMRALVLKMIRTLMKLTYSPADTNLICARTSLRLHSMSAHKLRSAVLTLTTSLREHVLGEDPLRPSINEEK